jgi:hypothetical protein
MLKPAEKAYFKALTALKNKDYRTAAEQFDQAAPFFEKDSEFAVFWETTRLLIAVTEELKKFEKEESLQIEDSFSHG